jgi:hypothetical protein
MLPKSLLMVIDDGWAKMIQGLIAPLGPLHLGSFFYVPQNTTRDSLILQL